MPANSRSKKRKTNGKKSKFSQKLGEKTTLFDLTYEELYNIVVSVLIIALIFAYNVKTPGATFATYPRALLAVSVVMLLHIAAQKFMASRLGCVAFYRLWFPGLIMSLLLMIIGLKPIVLVGVVSLSAYKFGRFGFKSRQMTMTEIGWIGTAGPATSIIMASLFKILAAGSAAGGTLFSYMAIVSGLIAFFSLLPIKPLDGSKVVLWDPVVWMFMMLILLLIMTPSGLLNYFTSAYIG
jgi:Zn-dependent protease